MGHFSNIDIANKLARIAKLYRDSVQIVARNDDDVSEKVLDILKPTVDIRLLENKRRGNKIHSKFMLVDADYPIGTVKRRRIAWAGSLNYTSAALFRNSETLVRMESDDVYHHLLNAWNLLKDATTVGADFFGRWNATGNSSHSRTMATSGLDAAKNTRILRR
jgi:phosphatidylserine/phosphatidylglycerophosphate/cardiolipin synthase-like enzyme